MIKCKQCTQDFKPKSSRQVFCGKSCYFAWWKDNKELHNAHVRNYRARRYEKEGCWRDTSPAAVSLKAWMIELKSAPCVDCGQCFETCCMDFDHKEGTTKAYNVGSMFAHHYSRELIQTELDKCELVCSNCHRIRTRDRRTGSGKHGKKNKE